MRNMSFALTTDQVLAGTKRVTRRTGWRTLKPGTLVQPVLKCMGLRPGERVQALRNPIRIVSVRREPLSKLTEDITYGIAECVLEGFGNDPALCHPSQFVTFFCNTHRCTADAEVTRIEFEYT